MSVVSAQASCVSLGRTAGRSRIFRRPDSDAPAFRCDGKHCICNAARSRGSAGAGARRLNVECKSPQRGAEPESLEKASSR